MRATLFAACEGHRRGRRMTSTLFHIVTARAWNDAVDGGVSYRAPSLAAEGFIHCSTLEQVEWVANSRFRDSSEPLVLLWIDPVSITADLRWEKSEPSQPPFPHIYGPLNLDAVIDVTPLLQSEDGFHVE
jgi:uncharacterized protein (DUF952 family)